MTAEGHFRFANYRLEPARQLLLRDDEPVALTPRSFDLLVLLVKNAGNVVSKDEILKQVWGPVVVEEGTLTWHVHALRQALGDDSAHFIETVPKRGYRFSAPLLARVERRVSPPPTTAAELPAAPPERRGPRAWWAGAGAVALAAVAAWVWLHPREPAVPYAKRDWLLITNFENQTGEPRFDRALLTALTVSLEQSTFVNVYSRERIAATLERMKKPPGTAVDEQLGREICTREGLRILVTPSITRTGGQYAVAARLLDPADGHTVRAYLLRAADEGRILGALQELAENLRRDLGESRAEIGANNRALAQVTTPLLGALQLYSDGMDDWDNARGAAAVQKFEAAVALDPEFAMAYAALGKEKYSVYSNRPDLGAEYFQRALALAARTTQRERQVIAADFAASRGRVHEAVRLYAAYAASYPDDVGMHGRMGVLLHGAALFPEAAAAYQEALKLDPDSAKLHVGLAATLGNTGDFSQALIHMDRALVLDPSLGHRHQFGNNYGVILFAAGQEEHAVQYFEKMTHEPAQAFRGWRSLGLIDMYHGRYAAAAENFRRAADAPNENDDRNLTRARNLAYLAGIHAAHAERADALRQLDAAVASLDAHGRAPIEFRARIANAYARLGDVAGASRQLVRVAAEADVARTRDHALVDYVRGEIARARGHGSEAVTLADAAWRSEPAQELPLVLDSLARAQLAGGNRDGAIAAFAELVGMRGRCFAWEAQEAWLLAHYELARLYHERGNDAEARATLEPLLVLWRDADADLPAVVRARALRASL